MEKLEQRHEQQERAKNTITTEHDSTRGKNKNTIGAVNFSAFFVEFSFFLSFGRAEANTS